MKPDAPPSFIPKPRASSELARRIQEAALTRRKLAADRRYAVPLGSAWTLACNMNPREHIGILFAEGVDPARVGEIHGGMWFSSYHDLDEPFLGTREHVVCDSCLAETGERTVLRVVIVKPSNSDLGTCFHVPAYWSRYLRLVQGEELEKYLGKGEAKPEEVAPKGKGVA